MTHVSRWQRLVGKAKCNHHTMAMNTAMTLPYGSVWSERPSAITACGFNQPGTPPAASRRNGQVRGRWRFPMREMPKVYRSRCQAESLLSELKRTTGSQLTALR
jgi:hypothetical protein